ncbi:MAG: penicillin acylase family protein, partial [Thiotrichales bacterium]|nr:penicillin acylase family protein [Thiotrichales bacterium]
MMKRRKWWVWGMLAVLGLSAAVGGAFAWLRGSLPQIDGERTLTGLVAPVEVVRDVNGIPHITATNEEDALFALGFVHAQDRMWQMEMNRRIGAGRLAEVLGAAALDTDRLLRVLGLHHRAKASLGHFRPD